MDALSDEVLSQIFELAIWPAPLHYFLDDTALANDREIGGLLEMPPAKKLGVRGVCRHWCRLATPIWLRYVLLNAQGPIKRLGYMLYKYPDLGKHVRHLRIGAEHAKLLDSVVKYLTNVETLCIYAQMQPNRHSNEGTLTALQRLNPVRLYIHGIRPMQMTPVWKSKEIREALYEAIRNRFTKLERVYIADGCDGDRYLAKALQCAKRLKVISLSHHDFSFVSIYESELFSRQDIQSIHCRLVGEHPSIEEMRARHEGFPQQIRDRIVYRETAELFRMPSSIKNFENLRYC